jgi:PBSX family phage terminase large subunit
MIRTRNGKMLLNKAQREFFEADEPFLCFSAGLGSGKSLCLLTKVYKLSLENRGMKGLIISSTYDQIVNNLFPQFREILDYKKISYTTKTTPHPEFNLPWGKILFRSAERPETIVGFNVAYAACDESALYRPEVFKNVIARTRLRAKKRQIIFASVPYSGRKGFVYERFIKGIEGKVDQSRYKIVYGSPYLNKANLSEDYLRDLEEAYSTPNLRAAFLEGHFVDLDTGLQIYSSFDEKKHAVDKWMRPLGYGQYDMMEARNSEELWLSADFGTQYVAWVFAQVTKIGEEMNVRIVDEIFLDRSNTKGGIEETIKKFGNKGYRLKITGDISGQTRQSAADYSDYERMKEELSPYFTSITTQISNNPRILFRYNAVNAAFRGSPRFQLRIHERCSNLIEDLKSASYVNEIIRKPDKTSDPARTHSSDALGYFLLKLGTPGKQFDRETAFSPR